MALTGKFLFSYLPISTRFLRFWTVPVISKIIRHESTESKFTNGESSSSEDEHSRSAADIDDVKEQILLAALEHVPEYGWTKRAIAEGAASAGYVGASSGLFGSAADLVLFFYEKSNYQLIEELQKLKTQTSSPSDVIRTAIELRLRMIEPYLPHWSQAQTYLIQPSNMWKASQHLRHLLDIISSHAGLQSSDMTWYSRRATLAAVYKSTELAFIADKTPGFAETWAFLDRRIEDFGSYQSCESSVCNSGNVFQGGLITFCNILGMNHLGK